MKRFFFFQTWKELEGGEEELEVKRRGWRGRERWKGRRGPAWGREESRRERGGEGRGRERARWGKREARGGGAGKGKGKRKLEGERARGAGEGRKELDGGGKELDGGVKGSLQAGHLEYVPTTNYSDLFSYLYELLFGCDQICTLSRSRKHRYNHDSKRSL